MPLPLSVNHHPPTRHPHSTWVPFRTVPKRDNECRYKRWCRATTARRSHSRHAVVELIELDSAAKAFCDRFFVSLFKLCTHETGQTHLSELQTDAPAVCWALDGKALGERGSDRVRAQAGMRPFSGQWAAVWVCGRERQRHRGRNGERLPFWEHEANLYLPSSKNIVVILRVLSLEGDRKKPLIFLYSWTKDKCNLAIVQTKKIKMACTCSSVLFDNKKDKESKE